MDKRDYYEKDGYQKGFTDGLADVISSLVKRDDFWGNHIYEVG